MQIVKRKSQYGIALIQVLIIAIVLTMLAIFINQAIREQISVSSTIQKNYLLNVNLETVEAELIHTILSNHRYRNIQSDNKYVKAWNFYGKPFSVSEGVYIELQDVNGLLSLNNLRHSLATRLFQQLNTSDEDIRIILDSISDWKDADDLKRLNGAERSFYLKKGKIIPRNGYLQTLEEVYGIRGTKAINQENWSKYFSLALISTFNPLNSPDVLLQSFLSNDNVYQAVKETRDSGNLSGVEFFQLTGVETDNFISLSTGKIIDIKISIETENNLLIKKFRVELKPNSSNRPLIISNIIWNE